MDKLENTLEYIEESLKSIYDEINTLEKSETVRHLYDLKMYLKELLEEKKDVKNRIQINKYQNCNHIWVKTEYENKDYEISELKNRTYYGCVKCGLNELVKGISRYAYPDMLNEDEKLMLSFMNNNSYQNGITIDAPSDLYLATLIYNRIKEIYPNIDDKTASHYLLVALNDINNIEVSDKRKENRIKRLQLKSEFY